jgi:hypothetical protein
MLRTVGAASGRRAYRLHNRRALGWQARWTVIFGYQITSIR